jgi:hypothetical protein
MLLAVGEDVKLVEKGDVDVVSMYSGHTIQNRDVKNHL